MNTFSVYLSDKKRVKNVVALSFDDAVEAAVGKRFFSASTYSYYKSGGITVLKFFKVLVKDPDGLTSYRTGKKLIRLKQISAEVSISA